MEEQRIAILENNSIGAAEFAEMVYSIDRMGSHVFIAIYSNDHRIAEYTNPDEPIRIKLPVSLHIPEWYRLTGLTYGKHEEYLYVLSFEDATGHDAFRAMYPKVQP